MDLDFSKTKSQIIATAIALLPAMLSILQNETGLALAYLSFFIVMYREGLPGTILVIGFSFGVLVVATLVVDKNVLAMILTGIMLVVIYFMRWQVKRNRGLLIVIIGTWALCVGIQRFAVPYIFNNVFECYQSQRIYNAVGQDYDCSQNKSAQKSEATAKAVKK